MAEGTTVHFYWLFWNVGRVVPVIGLVQAGEQARADRYTYLPQIGLYVLIAWGVTDLMTAARWPATRGPHEVPAPGPRPVADVRRSNQGRDYRPFRSGIVAV